MKLRQSFWAVFACVLLICCASRSLSPNSIREQINKNGAKQVVTDLYRGDGREWEFVLSQIEAGSPQWLELAPELRPGTDAATTLGLEFSVSRALPESPQIVLQLIGTDFQVERICTIPYIEADPNTEVTYLDQAKRALQSPLGGHVEEKRKKCLALIEELAASITSN